MNQQRFPPGWDEERVRKAIEYYDNLDEDEMLAEDEAAQQADGITRMAVPTELVPEIRALIARKQGA